MAAFKAELNTFLPFNDSNFGFTTRTIGPNTANSQSMVFDSPFTGTLTRAVIYVTAEAIAAASTLRYGIQSVISNGAGFAPAGIPDGTFIAGTQGTIDANTLVVGYNELTGMSFSLTEGEQYAFVMRPDTNWTAGYTVTVRAALTTNPFVNDAAWYHVNGTTPGTGIPLYGLGTSTRWYGFPCPLAAPADSTSTTAGPTNQIGFSFSLPSTVSTYKVSEIWVSGITYGYGGGPIFRIIRDSDNVTMQSGTTNIYRRTSQILSAYRVTYKAPVNLAGGVKYWFVAEGPGNTTMRVWTIDETYAPAYNEELENVDWGFRNATSGAWTKSTSPTKTLPTATVVLEDIVMTGGGGGTSVYNHVGMTGGIRG
jgi:hypothetical protein